MNLEKLEDKKILLFGKSRAFSMDEFASQLKFHRISMATEFEENLSLVVEGRMMTPYEQNAGDALYKEKSGSIEFVSIDVLEKELAKHIDANTLLMSLRLSRNKERLKSFIQNPMIDDELFFKLLKMYTWSGEDFFENDDNRDVSAAIIGRFYKNIERNHNVQYATSGFMHLISQTSNQELIEAIAGLEPLLKVASDANRNILRAISSHVDTPKNVLTLFIKKADPSVNRDIAMRDDCDEEMQQRLHDSMNENVLEALSWSKNLAKNVVYKILEIELYAKNMARNITLDDELFTLFVEKYPLETAKNSSLSLYMQQRLMDLKLQNVNISLASNTFIDAGVAMKLLHEDSSEIANEIYKNSATPPQALEEAYKESLNHLSLSCNVSTPPHILLALAQSGNGEVLKALAQNPATPVEVLYQLQLDARFARAVKENPAFGR